MASVALPLMGGLYTEAQATDLPPGASPLVINDDFIVGSVYPRPGKKSVFNYEPVVEGFTVTVNGKEPTGVSVGLQNTLVHLSAAQIKSAFAAPLVLIPAPTAPNHAIVPKSAIVQLNFNGTAYTVDPNVTIGFGPTSSDVFNNGWMMYLSTGRLLPFMRQAATTIDFTSVTGSGQGAGAFDPSTHVVNQPLVWANGVDISANIGDSTITMNIQWIEIDVTTGEIFNGTPATVRGTMTELTNAQLDGNAVIELAPAPGAGLALVPFSLEVWYHAVDSSHDNLQEQSPLDNFYLHSNTFGPITPSQVINQPLNFAFLSGTVLAFPRQVGYGGATPDDVINTGVLNIKNRNTSFPLTSTTVYLQYLVVNVATGQLQQGGGDVRGSFTELSADDIKNAESTPVLLAPAGGPDTIIFPFSYVVNSKFVSTHYPAVSGQFPSPSINIGVDSSLLDAKFFMGPNFVRTALALFTGSADQMTLGGPQIFQSTLAFTIPETINTPIQWADPNDFSASSADSTASACVQYIIVDLTTGDVEGGSPPPDPDAKLNLSLITPAPNGSPNYDFVLPPTDGSVTFGSPTDTWGFGSLLTAELLDDPAFGVLLQGRSSSGNVEFDVSGIDITVYLSNGQTFTGHASVGANGIVVGLIDWTDPNNISFDTPGTYAILNLTAAQVSQFLIATVFNLHVPIIPHLLNINYLKTFAQTDGGVFTLVLGSNGVMYQEDAINDPFVLTPVYTAIEPDSFAQSCTEDDREFIAISDLLNGTDIPYTYDGTNFDRLSQVGPGAPPSAAPTSAGSDIVSITQHGAISLLTGNHDWLLVSDAPSDHGDFGTPSTPGNVMSIVFRSATLVPTYIKPGTSIVLSGFPTINGNIVNNDPAGILAPKTYTVTSVGLPIPGQDSYDAIVFTVPFTTFYVQKTPPGCSVQSTVATMTTATQIPNLEVGGQFQIAGTGGSPPTGYDGAYTVVDTPNASQLQITSTALSNNIATYAFNLISGALPTQGESVTIGETLNGDGIFNVVNAVIQTATAGSFTLQISAPQGTTILAAAESGFGIIFGTIFTFDAGEIVGNKTGGTIVTVGLIAAGIRKVCYSYVTRNGYVSKPSPIRQFDVPTGATGIAIANLLTGPSNVIRRIVHITAANGGNFYNIPIDVPFTDPVTGIITVSKSTWVNDNSTTNVVLSFSDDALIAGLQIDIQGNNLFETAEVGSAVGVIPYAARVFAIGEQNKLTNWNNWSFDGGIGVIKSIDGGTLSYPAGWTLDPATGAGGTVSASPLFGNAYQISNLTGNPQAVWGQISQNMALDEFGVPIIEPSTKYSVRVTAARLSSSLGAGSIVVDLFSATLGVSLGTFSVLFANLGTTMLISTGTLLTRTLAPVPTDLVIRLYGANMQAGDSVLIDRIEVFPSEKPNLSTEVTGSYVNDFEAFDQVTGVIGCAVQNQQAVKSAFTLYDSLYIVKEHSLLAVKDNESTEPQGWEPRVVSNAVGTTSIYGVTTGIDEANAGEEWAVIAGQPGAFLFNGGQPIKLTEEIQQLWNLINWKYGHTLWVKNDIVNRRILIGVPLKVPNKWFPTGLIPDDSNPTTPNVILMLNYKQLNTAGALGERAGIRVAYSGKVIATEMVRKWSIWTIKTPCAAFITRRDTTSPFMIGNSDHTGKIYQLIEGEPDGHGVVRFVDGSGLPLSDDGLPFPQLYDTYGFITEEQEGQYKMTSARKGYDYMWLNIDGGGELTLTVYPNTLDSPYAHILLPNLNLPGSTNGDLEYPLNETAARLFLQFKTFAVGAGFFLSQVTIAMRQDPWASVRGRNI